jgi:hypothetical protein
MNFGILDLRIGTRRGESSMYRFVFTSFTLCGMMSGVALAQNTQVDASRDYELVSGIATTDNDGTFNYQGYLEVDGEPANGMYSFRFEAFENPTGLDPLSELFFVSPVIPVVDGLFNIDVQMGGDANGGRLFWSTVGGKEMHLEIGIGPFEGGPYETLGMLAKVGWSARAQYSGISEALRFPYIDFYEDVNGDQSIMMSLNNAFGGTTLDLTVGQDEDDPILSIRGSAPFGGNFQEQNGAVHIDALNRNVGLFSIADQYGIVGLQNTDSGNQVAAILGQVNPFVPNTYAVWARNFNSGNEAALGTDTHAGDFAGNLIVDGDIERTYDGVAASAAPIAYGYINSSGSIASGTSNFTCTWDAINDRYLITIDNESYFFNLFTTIVTSGASSSPRIVGTSSVGGQLVVYILDPQNSFNRTQANFQFTVFKTNPNITVINRNTTTMDDSDFYELHGLSPEIIQNDAPVRPRLPRADFVLDR